MNKLLTLKNNGKLLESTLLILLGVVVAFTFFFAFSSVDLVANAEEENVIDTTYSMNSVPVASGAVLVYDDFEQELEPLWSYTYGASELDLSFLDLTAGVYQIVCEAWTGLDESLLITNLVYVDSQFPAQPISLSDYAFADSFFTVILDISVDILVVDFFNTYEGGEGNYVTFLALYKIEESSSSGVNVEQITDIMFDGVSFSANAIASSISYTFDNLFLNEDGSLTIYTQLVIWFAGISLLLSFVRLLTDWLFSLGGNKDKL